MTPRKLGCILAVLSACWLTPTVFVQEPFSTAIGTVKVEPVQAGGVLEVPYITWGGDVATFHANGGLTTKPDTLFYKQGLNLKLVPGDDFPGQVKRYLAGKTPFLRGTMSMLGQASEVVAADPRTKAVVFLHMTWSVGDHMVARAGLKTISDLKGKKVVLQRGGPHAGMLNDILRTAKLSWKDINVVWLDELTGDKGPAAQFRKDASLDACLVISPDMLGLTGGLASKGSGAEGTVKDAHVLISTATMNRSIADVYACRKDFYDAQRETVDKFMAGYLKACEEIVELRRAYEKKEVAGGKYKAILKLTQDVYGKDVIPTLEVDAHGLIADATFVGLPGNIVFFTQKPNPIGFEVMQKAALDLAVDQSWVKARAELLPPTLNTERLIKLGGLTRTKVGPTPEPTDIFGKEPVEGNTIYSFTINFKPNQQDFDSADYGPQFQEVIELAARFGNAIIAVRGHADPTKTLFDMVQVGLDKGILKRDGKPGAYEYYLEGKKLDLTQTKKMEELITAGGFEGGRVNPRDTMQAALNLSQARADAVKEAVLLYAKTKGYTFNKTQLQPVGVGIREPLIARPRNLDDAQRNMRVEFRLLRIPGELTNPGDFP